MQPRQDVSVTVALFLLYLVLLQHLSVFLVALCIQICLFAILWWGFRISRLIPNKTGRGIRDRGEEKGRKIFRNSFLYSDCLSYLAFSNLNKKLAKKAPQAGNGDGFFKILIHHFFRDQQLITQFSLTLGSIVTKQAVNFSFKESTSLSLAAKYEIPNSHAREEEEEKWEIESFDSNLYGGERCFLFWLKKEQTCSLDLPNKSRSRSFEFHCDFIPCPLRWIL